jgi:hypothetical protein
MAKGLKAHHRAWLQAHPNRSSEWLQERLRDGFHIHHVDGDHSNNDPHNLVLIEGLDHFMLHSGGRPPWEAQGHRARGQKGPRKETLARGQAAASWRREGLSWAQVAQRLKCSKNAAMSAAKLWSRQQV